MRRRVVAMGKSLGKARQLVQVVASHRQREGGGFVVRRPFPGGLSDQQADPFLLLDELGPVEYRRGEFPGAPAHPHRGFSTLTYLKAGEGRHEDSLGNTGVIRAGGAQLMHAASGIIHDEGRDHPGGKLHGFQLWINSPASRKMEAPSYQDVSKKMLPEADVAPGVHVKAIVGPVLTLDPAGTGEAEVVVESPVQPVTPVHYLDYQLEDGSTWTHVVPRGCDTVLLYVYEGTCLVNGQKMAVEGDLAVFAEAGSDHVYLEARGGPCALLALAGKKLREPVVRQGPFVMASERDLRQAFLDYQAGPNVFCKQKAEVLPLSMQSRG